MLQNVIQEEIACFGEFDSASLKRFFRCFRRTLIFLAMFFCFERFFRRTETDPVIFVNHRCAFDSPEFFFQSEILKTTNINKCSFHVCNFSSSLKLIRKCQAGLETEKTTAEYGSVIATFYDIFIWLYQCDQRTRLGICSLRQHGEVKPCQSFLSLHEKTSQA